jgi:glc operon protein GlcG
VIQQLSIGLADARIAVEAVLNAGRSSEARLAVAVVDANGNLVYQVRQNGAGPLDVRDAERKAYTAAYIGRDTSMWRLQIRHDGRTVADWANPMLTTLHGGWTLRRASAAIGGLGVAGSGDEDRDEQLALKGAEATAQLAVDEWRQKRDPRRIRDRSAVPA